MNITLFSQAITNPTVKRTSSGVSTNARQWGSRIALFILLLICSLAVFMFAPDYYKLFPTNGNLAFTGCLTACFLIASLGLHRDKNLHKYWGIAYAFFMASAVNLVSILFAGYSTKVIGLFGPITDPNMTEALDKLYDTLLVVIPVVVLTLASRADLGSLYLKRGNHYWVWGFGIGALILVDYFTSVLIFFGLGYEPAKLGSAILWGLVFSFSNSMLEELWVRGIVMKRMIPLIGAAGTVVLTSITFAAMHFLSVSYMPSIAIPIFVLNTVTLGLACGILMVKTDSIWGAYLIHAAADLFLFIATLAAR